MSTKRRLVAMVIGLSLLLLLVAIGKRNHFTDPLPWAPGLAEGPIQTKIDRPALTIETHGRAYAIQPLYDYEFTALVVSFKRFHPGIGLHERWNDYLNIADLCVVFGENTQGPDLNAFRFWNGEFTCNYATRDSEAWQRFRPAAFVRRDG